MTSEFPALVSAAGSGRARWLTALLTALAATMFAASTPAQAPAAPGGSVAAWSPAELEKLVDRIALYPDDLVAIILPASTNPLQLVQADRFLEKRKADKNLKLDDNWDDPVKTLLNYPEVVKMMSADLDWTSELGEAVVADLGAVMEAVQVFRRKTQSAGNLKSDDKQSVVVEKEVIKIVPADPQVIYVPQYNPSTVVVSGAPFYPYYPPYPSYYYPYPPGAALATGIIWGAALGAIWNGGHYGANYGGGGNTINIDNSRNTNVNRGGGGGSASQRPAGSGSGSSQWKSNKQPGQVSSSTGRTQSARVGDTSARGGGAGAGAGGAGGARPSTQPAGGGRDSGGAFGGSNSSGRQAQMDSSRGASSRGGSSSFSGQAPRSDSFGGSSGRTGRSGAPTGGGGARSGGGGGGGRGGGGGGGRR